MATFEEITEKFDKLAHYFSNEKQQHAIMMLCAYMTYRIKLAEAQIPFFVGATLSEIADSLTNETPDSEDDSMVASALIRQAEICIKKSQTLISENNEVGDGVYGLMEQIEAFYAD